MIGSKGDLKQGLLGALTAGFNAKILHAEPKNPLLKLPPDNRLRTPPVTPWAISWK
jgi:hypothetical protein